MTPLQTSTIFGYEIFCNLCKFCYFTYVGRHKICYSFWGDVSQTPYARDRGSASGSRWRTSIPRPSDLAPFLNQALDCLHYNAVISLPSHDSDRVGLFTTSQKLINVHQITTLCRKFKHFSGDTRTIPLESTKRLFKWKNQFSFCGVSLVPVGGVPMPTPCLIKKPSGSTPASPRIPTECTPLRLG